MFATTTMHTGGKYCNDMLTGKYFYIKLLPELFSAIIIGTSKRLSDHAQFFLFRFLFEATMYMS